MEIIPALQRLGLGAKEIRVYIACLTLGPAPVRKIAHEASVNRGTTYDCLKRLIDLGLVAYYHRDKHQYFVAENPEKLHDVLAAREQELAKSKEEITAAIPELRSLFHKSGGKPVVRYYEGYHGIRQILQDVLRTMEEREIRTYYVYSCTRIREVLHTAYPTFTDERIKRKVHVRAIAIGKGGEPQPLSERKWLTKENSMSTYIILYRDKSAFISVDSSGTPLGVIMEDEGIAKTQKMLFEYLWKTL